MNKNFIWAAFVACLPFQNFASEDLPNEEKSDVKQIEALVSFKFGPGVFYSRYPGAYMGLTARVDEDVWGLDLNYRLGFTDSFHFERHSGSVIPFYKAFENESAVLLLGAGLGYSKSRFWFIHHPTERYYFVDTHFMIENRYFVKNSYFKSYGFNLTASQPTILVNHTGRTENYRPALPTLTLAFAADF